MRSKFLSMQKEVHNVTLKLCSFVSFNVAHLTILLVLKRGCNNVVSIVTGVLTGQSRVQIPEGQEVYLFPKMSRLTLGPAQPPIKWVTGFLPWKKQLGCDIYPSPSSPVHGMNRANITFISSLDSTVSHGRTFSEK